jgi:hypothetical protein
MKAEVLEEVKKEVDKMLEAGHQAMQVCRVDFKCCTCAKEGWPMATLRGLQRPQRSYIEG